MDTKTGRCAILLPHGVLNRIAEREMREALIKHDILDCVIGIGKNLFFNSPMEACILVARHDKPDSHKGKVLFVRARHLVERKNTESYLLPEHIDRIAKAYREFSDVEGFSAVVSNAQIADKDASLSVNVYVGGDSDSEESVDLQQHVKYWDDSSRQVIITMERFSARV